MRIRRRPPASQAPDPCLQIQPSQHPQNVTMEATQHPPGTTPLVGLHPDVDLSLDPHPSCIPSLNLNLNQAVPDKPDLQEEEEEEEEDKKKKKKKIKKDDVDATKIRDFHVNSNNKSGARVLSGERKVKAKAVVNTSKTSDEAAVNVSAKEEVEEEEEERVKKRRSPAVLMEGSRCSRVNGRGWRCCQQTLVGYSLCEHHLGKGRLRSMSSVRGQLGSTKLIKTNAQLSEDVVASSNAMTEKINGNEDGENKCKKIGIVKARSISSLLG